MATQAAQAYLIASFNFLLAGQDEEDQLSHSQIVTILYEMAENEDMRSFHEHAQSVLFWYGEYNLYRL